MAGTQGGGGGGSKSSTPPRVSPRASMDATLDLLTGLYPVNNHSPSVQVVGEFGGRGGARSSHNPPKQVGAGASEANPNIQNLMSKSMQQQYQHQPLDLLTGVFPPPSTSPSPVVSTPTLPTDNAWGEDLLAHPAFGSGSGGSSSGSPLVARSNNPFLENAGVTPAYSPPPHPVFQRGSDAGMASIRSGKSGSVDGSFAKFPPIVDSMEKVGLGTRSYSGNTGSPDRRGASRAHSAGNLSSPTYSSGATRLSRTSNLSPQSVNSSAKHSSVSSGIGLERMQNGPSRAESSRSAFQNSDASPKSASVSPSSHNCNIRRSASESQYEQRIPSGAGTSSRAQGNDPIVTEARAAIDEFVGAAGEGIYKAPMRGAVHPSRPVSLELRPHPLRGAPTNQVTRLTCLEGSVWATCDLGLMVWDVENATGEGCTGIGNEQGDEDAAAYEVLRVQGSSAVCMIADDANQVIWTGHRDGKMRSWPGHAATNARRGPRSASLIFQAHWPAVTALVFTPYGELWAGSETGELKAWPWEAVAKALSGVGDGASLMEKSYNDLRIGNLGVGPFGPINPELRFLIADHAHGTVWCAGMHYIAIWDARTRERLKIFVGSNGLYPNSIDVGSSGRVTLLDEELKVGCAKVSNKKDKGGWLQRSRNAVLGAADAVRRVASGVGQGSEDGRRLEALVAAADGTMWGGYANGILVQWDWEGFRRREFSVRSVGVRCLCVVGNHLWVGYSDGKLQVLAGDTAKPVGSWLAHRLAVIQMAVCGGYVFSLGFSGSIRGWNISSPDGRLDGILTALMSNRADSYTSQRHLQVFIGTWNTAEERSSPQSARTWLASAAEASLVVVGLQEVEMGAGAIGMAVVKETVGGLEKGSPTGFWWLSLLDSVLGEGFERVGSRQLAGMLVGVWVRQKLLPYVGDVEVGAVACGFGRALGNKGAVGVRLTIFRRTICVLTSHLAAHIEHTSRRNSDFEHIYNQMSFGRGIRTNVTVVANAAAGVSSAVQSMLRGGNFSRRISITSDQNFVERALLRLDQDSVTEDGGMPELADADLLIWTGDLNYRIDYLSYEEIISLIRERKWDTLLSKDQLRYEMKNGRAFNGLREGAIRFQPTYKFDKGTTVYDTSEKKRFPAWCDRILFRDSFGSTSDFTSSTKQGLVRPCKASVVWYEACMEPDESDHKPVRCMLSVDLSVTDEADRRHEYGHIMHLDPQVQTCLELSGLIPETVLSTNRLVLEDSTPAMLRLSNGDKQGRVLYAVYCEGVPNKSPCPCRQHSILNLNDGESQYPRGGYGFLHWLQVEPAAGVLKPSESIAIKVKAGRRRDNRGKDHQEQVVILVVNVKGDFSSQCKQHRICVSHGLSSWSPGKEGGQRHRSHEQQPRPSSAENDSQTYASRLEHGSSGSTRNTPDLQVAKRNTP